MSAVTVHERLTQRPTAETLAFYREWADGNARLPARDRINGFEWIADLVAELSAVTAERDAAQQAVAGWMAVAVMNGAYITTEFSEWAQDRLAGEKRTPAEITQSIIAAQRDVSPVAP